MSFHEKNVPFVKTDIFVYNHNISSLHGKLPHYKPSYQFKLVLLRFNVPVNNFSVISGQSHCFLDINQYSGDLMYQLSATDQAQAPRL